MITVEKTQSVLDEINEKMGEHLEMLAPEQKSRVIIATLARMVLSERDDKEFYKKVYEKSKGKM